MLVEANASRLELSDDQYADIQNAGGHSMPPFTVRNASTINQNVTKYAAPEGFIDVPVHTYMANTWED
jgi:hypothetical protein